MDLCLVCLHQAGHLSFLRMHMSPLGTNKIAAQEGKGWEVFFFILHRVSCIPFDYFFHGMI